MDFLKKGKTDSNFKIMLNVGAQKQSRKRNFMYFMLNLETKMKKFVKYDLKIESKELL